MLPLALTPSIHPPFFYVSTLIFILGYTLFITKDDIKKLIAPLIKARDILKRKDSTQKPKETKLLEQEEERIRAEIKDESAYLSKDLRGLKNVFDNILHNKIPVIHIFKLLQVEYTDSQRREIEKAFNQIFSDMEFPDRVNQLIEALQNTYQQNTKSDNLVIGETVNLNSKESKRENNFTRKELVLALGSNAKSINQKTLNPLGLGEIEDFSFSDFLNIKFIRALYGGRPGHKAKYSPEIWEKLNK